MWCKVYFLNLHTHVPMYIQYRSNDTLLFFTILHFFIQITSTVLTIMEGSETEITFRLTVPFGCNIRPDNVHKCIFRVQMYAPETGTCNGDLGGALHCRQEIKSENWDKNQSFKIYHRPTGKYRTNYKSYIILLEVKADQSKIWNEHKLPTIQVMHLKLPVISSRRIK